MTNTQKLKAFFLINGMTQKDVAKKIGLSPFGLWKKLHNKSEFKASEIDKLCELLGIDDRQAVFFALYVD